MKYLILAVGVVTLGARLCSGSEVYGYTGQDPDGSGGDSQFSIIANTVDNHGVPEGGTGDPNFDAFLLDASSVTADGFTTLALPQGGSASWVGPQANQTVGTPGGPIAGFCCFGTTTYDVQVDLTGFDLADTTLELILAADDVVSVTLDGNGIYDGTAPMFGSTTTVGPISVSGDDLVNGLNALNFVVDNSSGGPTGLDAYFQFDDGVPEPQTFTLMALGLAGLGALRLRRS